MINFHFQKENPDRNHPTSKPFAKKIEKIWSFIGGEHS